MIPLRFGITPREWEDFLDDAVAESKLAESLGFDSVWFEEHHMHPDYLPSPLVAIAALSQHVQKMAVGTNIAILPLYHPFRFAEDVAVLHQVTKGKIIVGVAVGYRDIDFENFGISPKERAGRMDEALRIIRALWTGSESTFNGQYYKLREVDLHPKLRGPREPEIWVGGWKRAAIRRAARLGDRWFPGPVADMDTVKRCVEIYKQELSSCGKPFKGIPIMRDAYLADTRSLAIQESKDAFFHKYQEDYSKSGHPLISRGNRTFEDWCAGRFIVGNADDAKAAIEEYREVGANYIVLRVSLPGLKPEQTMKSIKIFGEKVLPQFKGNP